MKTTILIFLFIYIIYALIKFYEFFYRKEATRLKGLEMVYERGNGKVVRTFDLVMFILMVLLIIGTLKVGMEYLSFIAGLMVGMTTIQSFFHRFDKPLPPEKMPKPPITALKMESYSVQAMPARAWRELAFMTVIFTWALYQIAHHGFHWF